MPHYDYQCEACGHVFEVFQSMTDPVLTACPECQGPVKRLIGAGAGLIFKGSGFYITDYKKSSSSPASSSSGSSSSSASMSTSSSSSSSDSKPAKSETQSKSSDKKTE